MDFAFSEEQDEFREVVARFRDTRWPIAETRRLMETPEGVDSAVWKQLAEELGLLGLALPEEYGGQGFGFLELGIALEELGRTLAGGPFLACTCLAAPAIEALASAAQKAEWLAQLAAGDLVATLATQGLGPGDATGPSSVRAHGGRLSGDLRYVLAAQNADLLLVPAVDEDDRELGLYAVRTDAPGVRVTPLEVMDLTRKQADVGLCDAAAVRLTGGGAAEPALRRVVDRAAIGLSAEMVGGAAQCLDLAVDYAKSRIQFARPIGSFQAIKHKAADVLLELESARSIAYWSWWVAGQDAVSDVELAEAAALARSLCADTYVLAARENLQIHGGMGFTWEADAHLYFRRARSSAQLLGSTDAYRARLARGLGFAEA